MKKPENHYQKTAYGYMNGYMNGDIFLVIFDSKSKHVLTGHGPVISVTDRRHWRGAVELKTDR